MQAGFYFTIATAAGQIESVLKPMFKVINNTKRHSLVQFVFKTACFSRKQNLQFLNSFIFNFKHKTNKWWYFFEQDWVKF